MHSSTSKVRIISCRPVSLLGCLVRGRLCARLRSFCHAGLSFIFLVGRGSLSSCFLSFGFLAGCFRFSCFLSLLLILVSCSSSPKLRFGSNVVFSGFIFRSGSCSRILILIPILICDAISIRNSNRFLNVISIREAFLSRIRFICSI